MSSTIFQSLLRLAPLFRTSSATIKRTACARSSRVIINKLHLCLSTGKSALLTTTPMAFVRGARPSLDTQSANSRTLGRESGMPGVMDLQRSNQEKLKLEMYVPRLHNAVLHTS